MKTFNTFKKKTIINYLQTLKKKNITDLPKKPAVILFATLTFKYFSKSDFERIENNLPFDCLTVSSKRDA